MVGFKNIRRYDNDGLSNCLEINLAEWLKDAFLRIGAIIPPRTTILQPDTSSNKKNLRVWGSRTPSWAYKRIDRTGAEEFSSPSFGKVVLTPATVTVNGILDFNAIINYAQGEVTFDRDLLETDRVEATHSTNKLSIFNVLELNRRPLIRLNPEGQSGTNGDFSAFEELAVSETIVPPFIIVETFPTSGARPICLGTGGVYSTNRVQMSIITESIGELSKILDILRVQSYWTVNMFNTNLAAIDGVLPIDPITGDINPSGIQYPELTQKYPLHGMVWDTISVRKFKTTKEDIHMGMAYFTVEIKSNPKI